MHVLERSGAPALLGLQSQCKNNLYLKRKKKLYSSLLGSELGSDSPTPWGWLAIYLEDCNFSKFKGSVYNFLYRNICLLV